MHIERYDRAVVNFRIIIAVFLLAALLFVGGASAETYSGSCGENLTWTLTTETGLLEIDGTGEMTDYSSSRRPYWYQYRDNITTVSLNSGVTSIGKSAFWNCTSLTSVVIPESVTSIGAWAFQDCNSLTSITIPDSVTNIRDYAFNGCTSLTSVVIPDSVTIIGGYAFNGCTALTSVTIGNGVTNIVDYAFYGCTNLQVVDLSDTTALSHVGKYAFGSGRYSALKSGSVIYVSDEHTAALFIHGTNYYSPNTSIIVGKPGQEITYTIKYDANGGTGSMADQTFTYNTTQSLSSNAFVKEEHDFSGWSTSAEGPVVFIDGQSVRNLLDTEGATLTLYSVWLKNENTPLASISLTQGWNFISVPKTLNASNNTAGSLFGSVETNNKNILAYNAQTRTWAPILNQNEIIQPLNGYWIYSANQTTITLTYPSTPTTPSVKTLYPGWNAIGLSSAEPASARSALAGTSWRTIIPWNLADGSYDSAIVNGGSDANSPDRLMTPGNGYWVYVDTQSTMTGLTA